MENNKKETVEELKEARKQTFKDLGSVFLFFLGTILFLPLGPIIWILLVITIILCLLYMVFAIGLIIWISILIRRMEKINKRRLF